MNAKIERMLEMDHKDMILDLKEEKMDGQEVLEIHLRINHKTTVWKGKEYLKEIATKVGLKVIEMVGIYPAEHLDLDRIQYKMLVQ
jgi:hypothetical protein